MAKYLCFDDSGNCIQEGFCADGDEMDQRSDCMIVVSDKNMVSCYLKGGEVKDIPEKPDGHWSFDIPSESWIPDTAKAETEVKAQRNYLLAESDWTDTLSAKSRLGDEMYWAWQAYRQKLRDVTGQPGYPFNVTWPSPPAK